VSPTKTFLSSLSQSWNAQATAHGCQSCAYVVQHSFGWIIQQGEGGENWGHPAWGGRLIWGKSRILYYSFLQRPSIFSNSFSLFLLGDSAVHIDAVTWGPINPVVTSRRFYLIMGFIQLVDSMEFSYFFFICPTDWPVGSRHTKLGDIRFLILNNKNK
jgi:hypothetical protein